MKAQIIHSFGDPSVFTLCETPIPEMKPYHVLIKVYATSVNPIDCKVRSGSVSGIAPDFPAILHGDVAGIIEKVGEGVTQFKKGDEIFGCAGGFKNSGGALAEFMLADEKLIAKKPTSISMVEAAALPLISITAWLALFEKAKLTTDTSLLIHGGVGGVGHVAVQLAKWCGASVTTSVRKKQDFAKAISLGADHIINAEEETVSEYKARLSDQGFDIVFDTVGGNNLDKSFEAAAPNGSVVTIAARSTHDLTPLHSKGLSLHCVLMLLPLLSNHHREQHRLILSKIAEIVDAGQLKPFIDPRHFTLETVGDAHRLLESNQAQGKIIITVA